MGGRWDFISHNRENIYYCSCLLLVTARCLLPFFFFFLFGHLLSKWNWESDCHHWTSSCRVLIEQWDVLTSDSFENLKTFSNVFVHLFVFIFWIVALSWSALELMTDFGILIATFSICWLDAFINEDRSESNASYFVSLQCHR